ncbi:hypothetical protein SFRURICE_007270 [Spodoptera frugiperda]|nr:hypothetical protein SFRURICE_007270 [Spodoptera frugiperda]
MEHCGCRMQATFASLQSYLALRLESSAGECWSHVRLPKCRTRGLGFDTRVGLSITGLFSDFRKCPGSMTESGNVIGIWQYDPLLHGSYNTNVSYMYKNTRVRKITIVLAAYCNKLSHLFQGNNKNYENVCIPYLFLKVRVPRPASHATDFSLSCIETHTTASTVLLRTDRIISIAHMRCVLMTSYGMRTTRVIRTMRACGRLDTFTRKVTSSKE